MNSLLSLRTTSAKPNQTVARRLRSSDSAAARLHAGRIAEGRGRSDHSCWHYGLHISRCRSMESRLCRGQRLQLTDLLYLQARAVKPRTCLCTTRLCRRPRGVTPDVLQSVGRRPLHLSNRKKAEHKGDLAHKRGPEATRQTAEHMLRGLGLRVCCMRWPLAKPTPAQTDRLPGQRLPQLRLATSASDGRPGSVPDQLAQCFHIARLHWKETIRSPHGQKSRVRGSGGLWCPQRTAAGFPDPTCRRPV